nr:PQQ-binding-like beta-propeller repeat protein [Actinomadura sp. RB99]
MIHKTERGRQALRFASLVAVFSMSGITGCNGGSSDPYRISAAKENLQPLPSLEESGPTAGRWSPVWRVTSKIADASFELTDGLIMQGSANGIDTYDGRTGALRWRTAGKGFSHIRGYEVSATVIVVVTSAQQWIGIDASNGRILWRHEGLGSLTTDALRGPTTAGTVPAVTPSKAGQKPTLVGIDARTGRINWRLDRQSLAGCSPNAEALRQGIGQGHQGAWAGGHYLAFPAECTGKNSLLLLNTETAKIAWRYDLSSGDKIPPSTFPTAYINGVASDGTTSITVSEQTTIITPDGRRPLHIGALPASNYSRLPPLLTAQGKAWVPYFLPRKGKIGQLVIDLRSGRLVRRLAERSDLAGDSQLLSAFDGKRIYLQGIPGVFSVTDAEKSTTTTITVPSTHLANPTWMLAMADSLYLAGNSTGTESAPSTTITRLK